MFMPTQEAALKLGKLLAAEGCSKLPVEDIQEVSTALCFVVQFSTLGSQKLLRSTDCQNSLDC
jgi:hypothetical protein